jgi:hypothetical protein
LKNMASALSLNLSLTWNTTGDAIRPKRNPRTVKGNK